MGEGHGAHVPMTNLPRFEEARANLWNGATAEGVVAAYLGGHKTRHTFRPMKSGMGGGSVCPTPRSGRTRRCSL
ncbi:MAG: hypothetical protein FWH47_04780 [Methanomassiliicoccaceae archaeon]|nr:hypothetical protein [Methanomassiliicoccaceae archaeon]